MSPTNTSAPPTDAGREYLLDQVRAVYDRSGTHLDRDVVDLHMLDTVDKAACSLLRDQWTDGFPVTAYCELLTMLAATRALLGYSPTPTAVDVNVWARGVRDASADAAGDDRDLHEVRICEGPYMGVVLALWGPRAAQAADTVPGPPLRLELPIEQGDSADMEYGTAYYARLRQPDPRTAQWEYILDRDRPFPDAGARPHMLPVPASAGEIQ
ncbi:hypothetical protein ACWDXD_24650 [Streptomyces sp. NPDC003314]